MTRRQRRSKILLECLDGAEFEDVVGARVDEDEVRGLHVEAIELLDHVADARTGTRDVRHARRWKSGRNAAGCGFRGQRPDPEGGAVPRHDDGAAAAFRLLLDRAGLGHQALGEPDPGRIQADHHRCGGEEDRQECVKGPHST